MSPTPVNLDLQGAGLATLATVQPPPFVTNPQPCFDGNHFIEIDVGNIASTGEIKARVSSWPGVCDYTSAGLVSLVISNQARSAYLAVYPVTLTDNTQAFCIAGLDLTTFGNRLLLIRPNLSTSGWFDDLNPNGGGTSCRTWGGLNYWLDWSSAPTLTFYTVAFDFAAPSGIFTQIGTGDVNTDAMNAFNPQPGTTGFYLTPHGLFGVDWNSGNNTGCWYCAYDCSTFGRVSFVMPDASLGPSSDPSQWFNFQAQNNPFAYGSQVCGWYPNFDSAGNWWWIRQPLQVAGNMVLEPLTSEVYSSLVPSPAGPAKFYGSPVGILSAGLIIST
jgi:hypothetical protein